MFAYQDPTGTNFLESQGALNEYRNIINFFYQESNRVLNSAFTLLDAFENLPPNTSRIDSIPWRAFPITAAASNDEIDNNRFILQDEYIEWRVERSDTGQISHITFTTEFPEYYEALAKISIDALIAGIKDVIPNANPTLDELFGSGFNPAVTNAEGRAQLFRGNLIQNPWNNGSQGILCLTQEVNTVSALFSLVDQCSIERTNIPSNAVCGAVACVPERNSDPVICQASQDTVRSSRAISLVDPAGIRIKQLLGSWEINGVSIDINDTNDNQNIWVISRNERRAILDLTNNNITLGGSPITSGAQISNELQVEADVISAPENSLPNWARTGQELTRVSSP